MSRSSFVALLIAAELVIVGIALYAIRGMGRVHAADFAARTIAPLDAGAAPQIDIDDPDSRVDVSVSSDGLVHVKDLTDLHGAFFGGPSSVGQLDVARTPAGVAIRRPHTGGLSLSFGSIERRIEVDVPSGSRLHVTRCSGARVSGIAGGVAVASQDGRIELTGLRGSVDAKSDDGAIVATDIRGDSVVLQSADGHLTLDDVSASSLDGQTKDGSIEARGLTIADGARRGVLRTDDGSIRVALVPDANLTVDASTGDGDIDVDGSTVNTGDGDSAQHTIRLGNGTGGLQLSSGDGSIHILTNGAV